MSPELRLLFACARVPLNQEDAAAIRQLIIEGIDWTVFVQKAVDHGLAGVAGRSLAETAPDIGPGDIIEAFRINFDETRKKNLALFDELAGMLEALAAKGVGAIPFKGPVIALQAYGDLGFRTFRDLDFLIRDSV